MIEISTEQFNIEAWYKEKYPYWNMGRGHEIIVGRDWIHYLPAHTHEHLLYSKIIKLRYHEGDSICSEDFEIRLVGSSNDYPYYDFYSTEEKLMKHLRHEAKKKILKEFCL